MIDNARADRIRGDARLAGRNDTVDCQECQERYEKCLADIEWWRQKANDYQAALMLSYQVQDGLNASSEQARGEHRAIVDGCLSGREVWRKRARKWKRRARVNEHCCDEQIKLRDEARADLTQAVKDFEAILAENTGLHAALGAMTARARGMREALIDGAGEYHGLSSQACKAAAGEPIP